jgi:aspartate/methionine/tyrosine aminotransferase
MIRFWSGNTMGKLLPDSETVRTATATTTFNGLLDTIEGNFINWKKIERELLNGNTLPYTDVIDISSATSMNLFAKAGDDVTFTLDAVRQSVLAYPYVLQKEFSLEEAFSQHLQMTLKLSIDTKNILVSNGTYAATRTLVRVFPGEIVLVPEFMNQAQKSSIEAMGKKVVEVPMVAPGWTLDVDALKALLVEYQGKISCMYLHHIMPALLIEDYLDEVGSVLAAASVQPVVDVDIMHTSHTDEYKITNPLTVPSLANRAIYLFTLSKEFSVPGLRVGFMVAPEETAKRIRIFEQHSLSMVPPVTRLLAKNIVTSYDIMSAVSSLQSRMQTLVKGLQSLNLEATLPHSGVNLFMHVPRDWEHTQEILPDHLFTYYCLTRAGVVLRPGSIYGHRLNHFVRFVVGQPESTINEMVERLRVAGVRGDMFLPEGLEKEYQQMMWTFCKENNKS